MRTTGILAQTSLLIHIDAYILILYTLILYWGRKGLPFKILRFVCASYGIELRDTKHLRKETTYENA
jgi:hypothetical protein